LGAHRVKDFFINRNKADRKWAKWIAALSLSRPTAILAIRSAVRFIRRVQFAHE
jgi:hypothetical protein